MPEPRSEDHVRLGAVLRDARKGAQMTIRELAEAAGVDRRYLAGIERGEINVAIENLLKIVRALRRTLADVMRDARL